MEVVEGPFRAARSLKFAKALLQRCVETQAPGRRHAEGRVRGAGEQRLDQKDVGIGVG